MFEDFLNHTCDIYHTVDETVTIGYGIEATTEKRLAEPGDTPDLEGIPCHFHVRSNGVKVVQAEPYSDIEGECKLSLPSGTDVRENDMVRDCDSGLMYRAGIPRTIHGNHHIIVMLKREGGVKTAI